MFRKNKNPFQEEKRTDGHTLIKNNAINQSRLPYEQRASSKLRLRRARSMQGTANQTKERAGVADSARANNHNVVVTPRCRGWGYASRPRRALGRVKISGDLLP